MDLTETTNEAKIKRFIESQFSLGEKYNYEVIQERFDKVLAREENKELRKFRLILEGVNKGYKSLIENKDFKISDWYINKLREFLVEYKKHQEIAKKPAITWEYLNNKNKAYKASVAKIAKLEKQKKEELAKVKNWSNSEKRSFAWKCSNVKIKRESSYEKSRGTYYLEADTDEFGCVVVCKNNR